MNLCTQKLLAAKSIVVLTGAGVSAESGVPTFRDAQTGLWERFRPEELATPAAFQDNPKLVWDWYTWRRELVSRAQPNLAHKALASMERVAPHFRLITQNVDDLHFRAGSQSILELHGSITRIRCSVCNLIEPEFDSNSSPPTCPRCSNYLRPDVVWFGESLSETVLSAAYEACSQADVFISIGTSTMVQPAASLPFMAKQYGAFTIEINPDDTPFSIAADVCLRQKAAAVLPALVSQTWT